MLVYTAADFEDFLEPRPEMAAVMEDELRQVVTFLAQNKWPFRLHATYNETIERVLNVYEQVNKEAPLNGLHWFLDQAETISDRNIERMQIKLNINGINDMKAAAISIYVVDSIQL